MFCLYILTNSMETLYDVSPLKCEHDKARGPPVDEETKKKNEKEKVNKVLMKMT